MFLKNNPKNNLNRLIILALIGLGLLTACGSQPTPAPTPAASEPPTVSDPKISAPTPQEPGQEVGISVDVSSASGASLTYAWRVDGGEIVRGDGSPAITYRTPDEPGIYNVRVAVMWDDSSVEKITTIRVEAPAVAAADTSVDEPPTDTPTPEPAKAPPTATAPPPTSTLEPTATLVPATATPAPQPTDTPMPTNTSGPQPTATTASSSSPQIISERGNLILNRGTIAVGIRQNDMYPVMFEDNGVYRGFEIDLAREIVQRLFGDTVAADWVPVASGERLEAVRANRIDFLIRNTTHTRFRENLVAFTSNYFWDGIRLLVRRGGGYTGIESMAGKTIVVPNYTTTSGDTAEAVVRQAAAAAGVNVTVLVDDDAYTVFNEGRADGVAMDWAAHSFFTSDYGAHQAVGPLLSSEPIAIAVSLNDPAFRDEVDAALREIIADGTWQAIYDRWFPEPPPWTIEEMLAAPPTAGG